MTHRIFVIDTNVLVAGLITTEPNSPTARILDAMLDGRLFYLLSADLVREYRDVLLRPNIVRRHGLHANQIDQILTEITANGIWHDPPRGGTPQPPDPKDTHLWKLLGKQPGAILITGDRLLIEHPQPQTSVISPATWAENFATYQ